MDEVVIIDVSALYSETGLAKLSELANYEAEVLAKAGTGTIVVLTGSGPIWLYLRLAHALHGKVKKLVYSSPATGEVVIFDHDPF